MHKIFSSGYFLLILFAYLLVLLLTVIADPFFGDAISSTSRAATHIFNQDLQSIFYPPDCDPGHPTLYSWLLALCWKIFGRTLAVSHLYGICWLSLLLFMFRRVAALFLSHENVNKATLLAMAMPVLLAQGAMMLNTVAVMTFFLAAVYGLLAKKNKWFLAGATLMMVTHLQGSFFLLGLAATDLFLSYREKNFFSWIRSRFLYYTIPFLAFAGWLFLHYRHTGWLFHSPFYNDADELNGPMQYVKSIFIMTWRLVDFGMLPLYVLFVYAWFKRKGDRKLQQSWLLLTCMVCAFMAIFLENTIGHRYFLAISLLMIIIVVNALQSFTTRQQNAWYLVLLLSLTAGNFLYYPGKNLGDGTLAYRSYFRLAKEIRQELGDSTVFYGYAPIANPSQFTYLDDTSGLKAERIDAHPLDSLPAIIQSNVNAEFSEADKQYLAEYFYGNSYQHGHVYVNVFLNPKYYAKPPGWKLREPSAAEQWMSDLKKKLKK